MSRLQTSTSEDDSTFQYSYYLHQDSSFPHNKSSLPPIPALTSQPHHPDYHLPATHHCISTIKGNNSYISSLVIGGKLLYTGSSNKEIRMWNRDGLRSEVDHENLSDSLIITGKGAVKSLVVSGDKIFSAHQDHKIRIWKVDENEGRQQKLTHLATLPTFGDRALKLLIPKNHVQVRRHKKSTWVHHVDVVSALALSRDSLLLYSVSWDRTLKIWQTTDFKCLESVANAHDDAINALALSSNGDVYTGSTDKKIKLWRKSPESKNHTLVNMLNKHKSGINALALSTNENILYSGGSDRSIMVWEKTDEDNMVAAGILRGHAKSILCLSAVSDLLCSGSADETIRIWRGIGKCYFCLAVLEGHRGPVKCLTSETDHRSSSDTSASYLIYSGGLDSDIKVWQILIPLY
ncbi:protein JINGUBANG-like [Cynara cardunculus var. scolymus]|uniref:protein JINGUBANG-like n=1 Tax=Cynara cardunculus var. scolymus TaxID=59895 RepID=UPI000D626CA3|nr:protein JINGUBANG-like [Cynara cardunculus var. scolymus]